ncbi:MAG: PA3496 family putative envelope integrity protein [Halioglobus sp.]
MGERNQEPASAEPLEDVFEPALGELIDEEFEELMPVSSEKQCLADKRRRAEKRLEEKRLRDEIGCYDLDFDLDD